MFTSFRTSGVAFILLFVLLSSCKKDPRILDTSVQPPYDKFSASVSDTLPVGAYTILHDSIISFNNRDKFLGSNIDPVFGRTDIGLYFNVNFNDEGAKFDTAIFVRAEFRIVTDEKRFLGGMNASCTYSVFPIETALSKNQFYFASNNRLHADIALPTTKDTVPAHIGGITRIRIPLDHAYAKQMFDDKPYWNTNVNFQSKYKGFYLLGSPSGGNGQIMACDMEHGSSGLWIYYKNGPNATKTDSLRLSFGGDLAVKYNTVKHDYSQASIDLSSQLGGDTTASQYVYVQGMGGTKVRINIPVKKFVSDSFELAVSRAELVLHVAPGYTTSEYVAPEYLSLLPVSSAGYDTIAIDQVNTTDNVRYDGHFDESGQRYVFNIARHVQAILKGEMTNRGFNLVVSDPSKFGTMFRDEHFERVVLGGAAHPSLHPVFILTYSRVSIR